MSNFKFTNRENIYKFINNDLGFNDKKTNEIISKLEEIENMNIDEKNECAFCDSSYRLQKCSACNDLCCGSHIGYCKEYKQMFCEDCEYNYCDCYKMVQCNYCKKEKLKQDILKSVNDYYICSECCNKQDLQRCDKCLKWGSKIYPRSIRGGDDSTYTFNICELCTNDTDLKSYLEKKVWEYLH